MKSLRTILVLSFATFGSLIAQNTTPTIEDAFMSGTKVSSEEPAGPITSMEFEQEVFEFGQINEGDIVKNVFIFKNTGSEPLIITSAKGSCGCTVPEFSKEPIMPGETGMILAVYDSKGKNGMQSKRVTVTANIDPVNIYLNIKGEVMQKENPKATPKVVEEKAKNIQWLDPHLFTVYPNPATDYLSVKLDQYSGETADISIVNNSGQSVIQNRIEELSQEAYKLDLQKLPAGIYTAIVKVGDKMSIARQFVISR